MGQDSPLQIWMDFSFLSCFSLFPFPVHYSFFPQKISVLLFHFFIQDLCSFSFLFIHFNPSASQFLLFCSHVVKFFFVFEKRFHSILFLHCPCLPSSNLSSPFMYIVSARLARICWLHLDDHWVSENTKSKEWAGVLANQLPKHVDNF